MPVYEQPFFKSYRCSDRIYNCPVAKDVTSRILNLPMYHEITDEMLSYVVKNVLDVVERN
jgi:dTDP-4-amino-4,6-dideoxygalactose transaminase